MKLIVFLLVLTSPWVARGQEIEWLTIEEAQAKTEKEPRKVFIDIVADWCKWCKVMEKETFSDKSVKRYITENYYAVRLDYESVENIKFLGESTTPKMLAKGWSVQDLPTIVFWDESFKEKSLSRGYQDADQFLKSLQFFAEF